MSPYDPRWPSPPPFTPRFRAPPGYAQGQPQPLAATTSVPFSHGYQQQAHAADAPYAAHSASVPYPSPAANGAYPAHPIPAPQHPAHPAPIGYPDAAPQRVHHPASPVQRRGIGAGAIVAILAVVFVVIGGGLGVGAFLLYGPSARLSDDVDQSAALRQNVQALMTAVRSGDVQQVKEPLLDLSISPDRAGVWFRETFGPVLGQKLQQEWERDVFSQLPSLIKPFKEANDSGQTEIRIRRVTSIQPGTDKFEQNVLRNRKQNRALYVVTLVHPGQQYGDSVYYFALVDGRFGYVGHMVSAW